MIALVLTVLLAVAVGAAVACWTIRERVDRGDIDTTRRKRK